MIGRSFALAEVTGVDLSPPTLESIGRALALKGNALYDLRADPVGGLTLLPAAAWDIQGSADPMSWTYQLQLAGPTMETTVTRPGSDILHFRVNTLAAAPWSGRSPLVASGFSAKLVANLERRASEESNAKVGTVLPSPTLNAASKTALLGDLGGLKGGVGLLEGFGAYANKQQQGGATATHWQPVRFGADPPEALIRLRRDAGSDIVAAFGIPPSLYSASEGALNREGWRQFGVAVQGWGELVASELSEKLERPISLNFRRLASIDVASRARAYAGMVQAGLDSNLALTLAGLGED